MLKTNFLKHIKLIVPVFLLTLLMVINYSCESVDEGFCDVNDDICEEVLITVCSSSTEEYYVANGDTLYCESVGNCSSAEDELIFICYGTSEEDDSELKSQLSAIMKSVRLQTY